GSAVGRRTDLRGTRFSLIHDLLRGGAGAAPRLERGRIDSLPRVGNAVLDLRLHRLLYALLQRACGTRERWAYGGIGDCAGDLDADRYRLCRTQVDSGAAGTG